jgi:hypothetical protein
MLKIFIKPGSYKTLRVSSSSLPNFSYISSYKIVFIINGNNKDYSGSPFNLFAIPLNNSYPF